MLKLVYSSPMCCVNLFRIFITDPIFTYMIWSELFKLCSYQSTLKQLFQEFEGGEDSSQLASVTVRIMQALQTNLDGKSKQYKDLALTHLFLMNNIHYIVRSVRRYVFMFWLLFSLNHSFIVYFGGSKSVFLLT